MARIIVAGRFKFIMLKSGAKDMKRYICLLCGFVYDEAEGHPDGGLAPGTKWADIPPNWRCPDCGACKADFDMVEI